MSKEKIVLSIIGIILGLSVAGGAFYIYQMTRTVDEPVVTPKLNPALQKPSPAPEKNNFLIINEPKDEQVFNKRIINIFGKTLPESTVIISTQSVDQVINPSPKGDFSLTATLEDGINIIKITAIFPNGEEVSETRTVTSTTNDF